MCFNPVHLCLSLILPLQAKRGPKVGDLIEIFRPDFQHWAVYVGDGYVETRAHGLLGISPKSPSTKSVPREKVVAKKELLDDVAGRDKYQVNHMHDRQYSALAPDQIVQRAEQHVGREVPYLMHRGSSRDFAIDMRYEVTTSLRYVFSLRPRPQEADHPSADGG
uniref:LRAT domain-containing protein n=1 Tax=Ursus maritimus TaxID=29073 RepID=A0A452SXQ2_URSMA